MYADLAPSLIAPSPLTRIITEPLHTGQGLSTVRVRTAFSYKVGLGARVALRGAEDKAGEKQGKEKE